VQAVLGVGRLGGDGEREVLRGQVPLLPGFALHPFVEVPLARLPAAESRARQEQAKNDGKSKTLT